MTFVKSKKIKRYRTFVYSEWDCLSIEEEFGEMFYYECMNCHHTTISHSGFPRKAGLNYCPNCGAKMILDDDCEGDD